MHPDDLKVVWRCSECNRNFVFHSDAIDHSAEFNHKMETMKLPTGRAGRLEQFKDDMVILNFRIEGKRLQMRINYRYYPRTGQVVYMDVVYSEPGLGKKIEGNLAMMRNVDLYLRSRAAGDSTRGGKKIAPSR